MAFTKPLLILLILVGTTLAEFKNIIIQKGDNLTISCIVESETVKWFFNSDEMPTSKLTGTGVVRNYTLIREGVNSTNAGVYECKDGSGDAFNTFNVTVVSIVGEDALVTEKSTDSIELACQLETDDIQVKSLRWSKNNTDLSNSTERYTFTYSEKASTLNISLPNAGDAGLYKCIVQVTADGMEKEFEQSVNVNMAPKVHEFETIRSRVEDDDVKIKCNVTGYPVPSITWKRKLDEEEEFTKVNYDMRINTTANSDNVPNAVLTVRKLNIKNDKGIYMCLAENELGVSNATVEVKVKDKLAAVWPFLGICAEVAILCAIIFIFEKKRSRKLEEEEEVDAVKQDLMTQANGDDHELRQRNAVKS